MTYREARIRAAEQLKAAGVENEAFESGCLLQHAAGVDLSFYLLHQAEEMPNEQAESFFGLVHERCQRIPLQHLTGEQEFMGLAFRVNGDVLIPRQDTELLAESAIALLHRMQTERTQAYAKEMPLDEDRAEDALRVLDLCTGSGCLAVSIKSFCPDVEVTASDISEKALKVAMANGAMHGADVTFIHSDLFANITGQFDVIVSNPPYIPADVIPTLMPEVAEHEPMLALDGKEDGLSFYRRIVAECGPHVAPGGWLLFEIGYDQGAAVSALMRDGQFQEIEVRQDLAGLDRVVLGRRVTHV